MPNQILLNCQYVMSLNIVNNQKPAERLVPFFFLSDTKVLIFKIRRIAYRADGEALRTL